MTAGSDTQEIRARGNHAKFMEQTIRNQEKREIMNNREKQGGNSLLMEHRNLTSDLPLSKKYVGNFTE